MPGNHFVVFRRQPLQNFLRMLELGPHELANLVRLARSLWIAVVVFRRLAPAQTCGQTKTHHDSRSDCESLAHVRSPNLTSYKRFGSALTHLSNACTATVLGLNTHICRFEIARLDS